jgi:Transposase, Mutator family
MTETTSSPLNNVITIDDERIKNHLDRVVRGSVEETLNALLDAEADRLCNAQRYERSAARRDTRAGHYERNLQTKAGEVRLKVPKLRQQTSRRSRRRSSSVIGGVRARWKPHSAIGNRSSSSIDQWRTARPERNRPEKIQPAGPRMGSSSRFVMDPTHFWRRSRGSGQL